jgi:hypothetical protein
MKTSIITDATHEINIDETGLVRARPRNGGRALLYSDFAEAETLEEFIADLPEKVTLVEILRDTEPVQERIVEEYVAPYTVEESPMVLVVDDEPPAKPEPAPPVITSDNSYKYVGNKAKPTKKNKYPNKR